MKTEIKSYVNESGNRIDVLVVDGEPWEVQAPNMDGYTATIQWVPSEGLEDYAPAAEGTTDGK